MISAEVLQPFFDNVGCTNAFVLHHSRVFSEVFHILIHVVDEFSDLVHLVASLLL